MKIKNIVKIATLMGLIATGSAYCMQAALLNGVKACIRGAGTAIGVGLPTVPFVGQPGYGLFQSYKDPIAALGESRAPSEEEEKFLRQVITDKNIAIRIGPDPLKDAGHTVLNKAIKLPNKTVLSDMTLAEALNSNTAEALEVQSLYHATAEHEFKHAKTHDVLKRNMAMMLFPCITTGTVAVGFKKIFPVKKNGSLLRHCGRFGAKILGGSTLTVANLIGSYFVLKHISHTLEYSADQNISPKNRDAMVTFLKKADEYNESEIKNALERQKINDPKTKMLARKVTHVFLDTFHPPVEERIKCLQQTDTKKS